MILPRQKHLLTFITTQATTRFSTNHSSATAQLCKHISTNFPSFTPSSQQHSKPDNHLNILAHTTKTPSSSSSFFIIPQNPRYLTTALLLLATTTLTLHHTPHHHHYHQTTMTTSQQPPPKKPTITESVNGVFRGARNVLGGLVNRASSRTNTNTNTTPNTHAQSESPTQSSSSDDDNDTETTLWTSRFLNMTTSSNNGKDDMPGSPVTASPPESPKGFIEEGRLMYEVSVVSIPHPEKADKGGEDAWFVNEVGLGVFDGVGGWASVGVDAGEFANELSDKVERFVCEEGGGRGDVGLGVEKAVRDIKLTGSSTACVVRVEEGGRRLRGVNLGDSKIVVIRDGIVVEKSREQQHYFNCPYQLGTDSVDDVRSADSIDWSVESGDWVVMATDGLWDNVFGREILEAVRSGGAEVDGGAGGRREEEWVVEKVAQLLAKRALEVGLDTSAVSPFSVNAHDAGTFFTGGKLDDITVVVCRVTEEDEVLNSEIYGHVVTRTMMMEKRFKFSKSESESSGGSDDGNVRGMKDACGAKDDLVRRLEKDLLHAEPIDDIKLS